MASTSNELWESPRTLLTPGYGSTGPNNVCQSQPSTHLLRPHLNPSLLHVSPHSNHSLLHTSSRSPTHLHTLLQHNPILLFYALVEKQEAGCTRVQVIRLSWNTSVFQNNWHRAGRPVKTHSGVLTRSLGPPAEAPR